MIRKPGALRNGAPFTDMPAPLLQLQRSLLKHEGGDRVMAQVLAAVPVHRLESVLVAVELALESGMTGGEHVLNVLARLKGQAAPQGLVDVPLRLDEQQDTDAIEASWREQMFGENGVLNAHFREAIRKVAGRRRAAVR